MLKKILITIFILIGFIFYLLELKTPQEELVKNNGESYIFNGPLSQVETKQNPDPPPILNKEPSDLAPSSNETLLFKTQTANKKPTPEEILTFFQTPQMILGAYKSDEHWIVQHDILVPEQSVKPIAGKPNLGIAELPESRFWPQGIIPYEIGPGVSKKLIDDAIDEFTQKTTLQFTERENEMDAIRFTMTKDELCQSFLGKQGGLQPIFVTPSCGKGQIIHEIMHALGFVHEQNREDRDLHIQIHWQEIQPGMNTQFQKMPAAVSIPAAGYFDFDSIMIYPSDAFSVRGNPTMTRPDGETFSANRTGLSIEDVEKIQNLYEMR